MTINLADNSPRVSYSVASGVTQTSFAVPFEFFADADLNVYVNGVLKTLTTNYTVAGGDGSTGTITMSVTGVSGGSSVVFTRSVPLERTSDFPTSGPFQIDALNTELDRLTAISADLQDQAARGLQLTDYDISANLVLPDLDGRKGTTLAFNATTGAAEAGPTISDVQSVADAAADIQTLAHIEDGTDATDAIQTVAGVASNVTTVAGVSSHVTTVAGNTTNVNTVATNIADVSSVATNMAEVLLADTNAATATTKASEAAASATAAQTAQTAAETAETNAETAETNAETAAALATTNGAAQVALATTQATNAATSATTATTQATNASSSATAAATSETNAGTSETNASGSATAAAGSATAAAGSASAAATSQTAAATSAAAAATALDSFDDRYLGSKTADPTVDNDGDALVSGALYFNSTANEMRVYDGGNWIAASSAGAASLILYEYTATSGQTSFSGTDDNSASLSYAISNIQVILNGVILDPSDYTATSGTSIVLATGAATGDLLNVYAFKSFTVADTVSASAGGTFGGNIDVTGTVTADGLTVDGSATIKDATEPSLRFLDTDAANSDFTIYSPDGVNHLRIKAGSSATDAFSIASSGDISFYEDTGTTAKFFWDASAESLGIGTAAPNRALTVHTRAAIAAGGTQASINNLNGNSSMIGYRSSSLANDSTVRAGAYQDNFAIYTGAAERMRIDSSGNLLVGTTVVHGTNSKVSVKTDVDKSGIGITAYKSSNSNYYFMNFIANTTSVGDIYSNGSSTTYATSSDYRLKENTVSLTGASERVNQLLPKRFNFINDETGTLVDGFLAHEVQSVVPEAILGTHDGMKDEEYEVTAAIEATYDDDGNELTEAVDAVMGTRSVPDYQGIDQSKLVPLLTAALQEALNKIDTMETRLAALEAV